MPEKIAIIDFLNQDCGLSILFPEADYFILEEQFDRTRINNKYNINPIVHNKDVNVYDFITDEKYDTIFIIAGLYGAIDKYYNENNEYFNEKMKTYLLKVIELINKNNFKTICFFDNFDYDYDPNTILDNKFIKSKGIVFFKRYYNSEKIYNNNVFPFPYITFGHQCNIELVTNLHTNDSSAKIDRIFFSGSPLHHVDLTYGIIRSRREMLNKISGKLNLYNPGYMQHELFMREMKNSKYSLDLLGIGDPNTRTYEIISCGSLRLGERSNLKWTFDDSFCEETIFDNEHDLLVKLIRLENDPQLYERCLNKQNEIVRQHMNTDVLRNYILFKIKKAI
jgi:hypothetical protein